MHPLGAPTLHWPEATGPLCGAAVSFAAHTTPTVTFPNYTAPFLGNLESEGRGGAEVTRRNMGTWDPLLIWGLEAHGQL